ncbi:MAG: hypothetical protein WDN67_00730 [Candidatus Moraniibacteriota bacterium]
MEEELAVLTVKEFPKGKKEVKRMAKWLRDKAEEIETCRPR